MLKLLVQRTNLQKSLNLFNLHEKRSLTLQHQQFHLFPLLHLPLHPPQILLRQQLILLLLLRNQQHRLLPTHLSLSLNLQGSFGLLRMKKFLSSVKPNHKLLLPLLLHHLYLYLYLQQHLQIQLLLRHLQHPQRYRCLCHHLLNLKLNLPQLLCPMIKKTELK